MKPRNRKSNFTSKKKKNLDNDDFFESAAKRRRKAALDEAIESEDSDEDAMTGRERENAESIMFSFLLPRMQVKYFIPEIAKNSVAWVMKDGLANLVSKTCYLVLTASFKG